VKFSILDEEINFTNLDKKMNKFARWRKLTNQTPYMTEVYMSKRPLCAKRWWHLHVTLVSSD